MHLGMCLIASVSSSNALDFCLYENVATDPPCLKGVFFFLLGIEFQDISFISTL